MCGGAKRDAILHYISHMLLAPLPLLQATKERDRETEREKKREKNRNYPSLCAGGCVTDSDTVT